jgi:hypothetical protein
VVAGLNPEAKEQVWNIGEDNVTPEDVMDYINILEAFWDVSVWPGTWKR